MVHAVPVVCTGIGVCTVAVVHAEVAVAAALVVCKTVAAHFFL